MTIDDILEQLVKDLKQAAFNAEKDAEFSMMGFSSSAFNIERVYKSSFKRHLNISLLNTQTKLEEYYSNASRNPPNRTGMFDGEIWYDNLVEKSPDSWSWDSKEDQWMPSGSTESTYIITDTLGNHLKDSDYFFDTLPKFGTPKAIVEIINLETWDPVTTNRISKLDSRVQKPAADFINNVELKLGIKLRIVQGHRSIDEQNNLYAQGRTKPGNIVTNAKGGSSYHNYGLAIDVVVMKDGKTPDWTILSSDIVDLAEEQGFDWGGDWKKFKDYPHFEMTFGKSISDLKKAKK